MKKIYFTLIMMAVLLSSAFAQGVKLGYVDTDRVIAESNEAAEISRLFNLDIQNWKTQLRTMNDEIKGMERAYEIDKLTKNEAAKTEAKAKIETKKAEAGRFIEEYFGDGGKQEQRYNELLEPLTIKIHNIIMKIAQDEDYSMIFDVSLGTVLYAKPTMDLTDLVIQELNKDTIKPTDEPLPGETTEQPKDDKEPPKEIFEPKK